MKKILLMFTLLICAVSINAQVVDTISRKIIKEDGLSHWDRGNPILKEISIWKADNIYTSSIYFDKGGNNLMWGGITLGSGVVVGMIPLLIENPSKSLSYGCLGVSGGLFITSIVQFIVGGHQISKGGMILRQKKNYIIETDGTSLKVKF